MTAPVGFKPPGSYGIDAPYLLAIPAVLAILGIAQAILTRQQWPLLGVLLIVLFSGFGLYANRRGKFRVWSQLLDAAQLRGDERVLDLGCGSGAVLVLAAARLTTGCAVGVDLWRTSDQSGASAGITRRNAEAAGVADRVHISTSDMRFLPFGNAGFNLVVSNIALHNVASRASRNQAIDEAVRVLKPGGRLLLADIRATGQYQVRLLALGMDDVRRANLGWRMLRRGPWLATRLVTATKPGQLKPSAVA